MEGLRTNLKNVSEACRITPIPNSNKLFLLHNRLTLRNLAIVISAGLILYFPARIILYSIQIWIKWKEYYPAWNEGLFDVIVFLLWFLTLLLGTGKYLGAPGALRTIRPSQSLPSRKGDGFLAGAYARDVSYTGRAEGWGVVALPVSGRQDREPTETYKKHLGPYDEEEGEEVERKNE
jgi:hypothetical protein